MPLRWVNLCPECGGDHPADDPHVGIRTASRQPSEVALDRVRRGQEPLPTRELAFTSLFTPGKNRPLTQEEKSRG